MTDFGTLEGYRVRELIGQGGMAQVYAGEIVGEHGFARTVAIKLLRPMQTLDPEVTGWFISEGRLGSFLSHPNIVAVLNFGRHKDRYFMVMEYVDGPTLQQVVAWHQRRLEPLPPAIALQILIQVCEGLEYAHRACDREGRPLRVVHRDLKPSNILLDWHGAAKISDFGVARASSNLSQTRESGLAKGTVQYMSPEQAWGELDLDHRSDLFSVGILLYHLLTLGHLYRGESQEKLLRAAQDAHVEPLVSDLPEMPARDAFVRFLSRSLAVDRERRFQSARETGDALRRILEVLPGHAGLSRWLEVLRAQWTRAKDPGPATTTADQFEPDSISSSLIPLVTATSNLDGPSIEGDPGKTRLLPRDAPPIGQRLSRDAVPASALDGPVALPHGASSGGAHGKIPRDLLSSGAAVQVNGKLESKRPRRQVWNSSIVSGGAALTGIALLAFLGWRSCSVVPPTQVATTGARGMPGVAESPRPGAAGADATTESVTSPVPIAGPSPTPAPTIPTPPPVLPPGNHGQGAGTGDVGGVAPTGPKPGRTGRNGKHPTHEGSGASKSNEEVTAEAENRQPAGTPAPESAQGAKDERPATPSSSAQPDEKAWITLSTVPADKVNSVQIDGGPVTQPPLRNKQVSPGTHELSAICNGAEVEVTTVTLPPEGRLYIAYDCAGRRWIR